MEEGPLHGGRGGDEFDGYITGVTAFGLSSNCIQHVVEGMVHVSTMAERLTTGSSSGSTFCAARTRGVYARRPRQREVVKVDMERRMIDLGLTEILARVRVSEDNRGPRRSKAEPKADRHMKAGKRTQRPGKAERQKKRGAR